MLTQASAQSAQYEKSLLRESACLGGKRAALCRNIWGALSITITPAMIRTPSTHWGAAIPRKPIRRGVLAPSYLTPTEVHALMFVTPPRFCHQPNHSAHTK